MKREIGALAFASCLVLGSTLGAMAATLPDAAYRCEMFSGMTLIEVARENWTAG